MAVAVFAAATPVALLLLVLLLMMLLFPLSLQTLPCLLLSRSGRRAAALHVVRCVGGQLTAVVRWNIDTLWTLLMLRFFAVSSVDRLKDGRRVFEGVDMARHRYGVSGVCV